MSITVTIQLPDEIIEQYQHGAKVARKELAEFLADRLINLPPFLAKKLPPPLDETLAKLEKLDDSELWEVAKTTLTETEQTIYDELLTKNSQMSLSPEEQQTLSTLGDKARSLTLQRAHAFMLLQWRGHDIPSIEELLDVS